MRNQRSEGERAADGRTHGVSLSVSPETETQSMEFRITGKFESYFKCLRDGQSKRAETNPEDSGESGEDDR